MKLAHQRLGELSSKNNVLLEEVDNCKKLLTESNIFGTIPVDQMIGHQALRQTNERNVGTSQEEASEKESKPSDPDGSNVSDFRIEKLS
jgi:hypothetical protein